jgi:hypothetical protein
MLHMIGYHGVLLRWGARFSWWSAFFVLIFVVVAVLLAHEVFGTLVFVSSAILRDLSAPSLFSAILCLGLKGACIHIGSGQSSR